MRANSSFEAAGYAVAQLQRYWAPTAPMRQSELLLKDTVRFYLACLVTFGLVSFLGYLCVHGFLTDQAPTMGRYARQLWFSRLEHPKVFWVSIVFHALLSLLLLFCGLAALYGRHLRRESD